MGNVNRLTLGVTKPETCLSLVYQQDQCRRIRPRLQRSKGSTSSRYLKKQALRLL